MKDSTFIFLVLLVVFSVAVADTYPFMAVSLGLLALLRFAYSLRKRS
jgi:hypothetical protein